MTTLEANDLFAGTFTRGERKFLFNHPEFRKMLANATDDDLVELNNFGVKLLIARELTPPLQSGSRPDLS